MGFRQGNKNSSAGGGTSIAVTLNGVLVGSGLVAVVNYGVAGADISSAAGSLNTGSAWKKWPGSYLNDGTNNQAAVVFYCANSLSGNETLTVSFSSTSSFLTVAIHEVTGVDTGTLIDQLASQLVTTGLSPSITPTKSGCYILGYSAVTSAIPAANPTVPGGWTLEEIVADGTNAGLATADQVQGTAAAINSSFTWSGAPTAVNGVLSLLPASAATQAPLQFAVPVVNGVRPVVGMMMRALQSLQARIPQPVVVVTVLQRKTLSPLGTHTGGRQSQ